MQIISSSAIFGILLLVLVHVLVRSLSQACIPPRSLATRIAAAVLIGSVFSVAILVYPAILYVMVDDRSTLIAGMGRDGLLTWVVACFVVASAPGALYFVRSYRPYRR